MTKLIEKDLVYRIIGCAMAVHNEIGHGFREKTYENALCVDSNTRDLNTPNNQLFPSCIVMKKLTDIFQI